MNSASTDKSKQNLNLYFQIHQPGRLRKFQFFDIGSGTSYFDDDLNRSILTRVASNGYLVANKLLLKLIKEYPNIRVTFSLSGVAIEQLERYVPAVLDSFRKLAATGAVEFLGETYYHSLSFFMDKEEFISQVEQHRKKIIGLFGIEPVVFRNTELIYSDAIGHAVADLGFKGIYLDGIEPLLKGSTTNKLYQHPEADLILLPRNHRLSDDIAFRYSDRSWNQWPLTPEKFVSWMKNIPETEDFICLGMDYETFGEHHKRGSGIFEFFEKVISRLALQKQFRFVTASGAISCHSPCEVKSVSGTISWADEARDLSAWLGNAMQRDAFDTLNKLYQPVMDTGDDALITSYRFLQTSDHFYYMFTRKSGDGNVHEYFSPYASPYEAFMNFMNVLADLETRVVRLKKYYRDPIRERRIPITL